MAITTVLFDLDGTLLPMDQDRFVEEYFRRLAAYMAEYGYAPAALVDAVWKSTGAVMTNDGSRTNEARFWQVFDGLLGEHAPELIGVLDAFYRGPFHQVKAMCSCTPYARQILTQVKEMGLRPVLATSPLFPRVATHARIRWAGLEPEDFAYITTYENSSFCKPNPAYYRELLQKLDLKPEECIMVGNDAHEDAAAEELGIPVFLLTDCLLNRKNRDISGYPQGGFPQLQAYLAQWKGSGLCG